MPSDQFTDAELRAYLDEQLPVSRSLELESAVRSDPGIRQRLTQLLVEGEDADLSLGTIWRRRRLSCPPRSTWALYLAQGLGDGLKQYLEFHLQTIGCRYCAANLQDLREHHGTADHQRTRRLFETSLGQLHSLPPLK